MVLNVLIGVIIVVVIWLLFLTFLFLRMLAHYNALTKGVSDKTLKGTLEQLLGEIEAAQKTITQLVDRCATIEKDGRLHIQRIGLLRFNPFKDTGGDQSFIVSILDGNNTGVVISGLHSRSGTRWYAKRVVSGKGVEYKLSEEEKRAVAG